LPSLDFPCRSSRTPESTQSTQEDDKEVEQDTVRSRSPFPLYITPNLKNGVQKRFEKFNAERTLNDEPQAEKYKHFMQGLLRAGLDHSDLEKYILEESETNSPRKQRPSMPMQTDLQSPREYT